MPGKGARSELHVSSAPVTVFAHLLAVAVTILVLVWLLHFQEGLAFRSSNKLKIFNVHPLLMVIGFLLVSGEALMSYKVVPAQRPRQKMSHMLLNLVALLAGIVGIYAVFKYHYEAGIPDMYSLHSWFGISTICLFGLQWVFGFLAFWYPRAETTRRARVAPWHALLGIIIFFMAVLTAETGLVEKFFFLRLQRDQEARLMNFTGLLILLYGLAVALSVLLNRY